jgi:hypothetical protein
MAHPEVNKYRSNKNPERQVVVAKLPDDEGGGYAVGILDGKNMRLVRTVVGKTEVDNPKKESKP